MRYLIGVLLIAVLPAQSATLWIVGEHFLATTDGINAPLVKADFTSTSSSFDPKSCSLWTVEANTQALKRWDSGLNETAFGSAQKLLTDLTQSSFVSLSTSGEIEERDSAGKVKQKISATWGTDSREAYFNGIEGWSFNVDEKERNARLVHFNSQLVEDRSTKVVSGTILWPNYHLMVDELSQRLWLGFAVPSLDHPYVPVVEERALDGSLKQSLAFNERGRFFSMCLDPKDRSTLVARDIPSENGFTVPVYSYLEKLGGGGKPQTYYSAEVNDFIDSMICEADGVWMAQHSIWGDSGVYLVHWDRNHSGPGERKFLLPGLVSRIMKCES